MKYFDLDTVVSAYKNVSETTESKFWGLLGILKTLPNYVEPCTSYELRANNIAEFLEDVFALTNEKKTYSISTSWYVKFSNHWESKLCEQMFRKDKTPDIIPVVVWAFRNKSFDKELNAHELANEFSKEFHLTYSQIEKIFGSIPFVVKYSDSKYSESELLKELKSYCNETSDNTTIILDKKFVKAAPGEFARAPFIQTLYSALGTMECLILTQINLADYYGERKQHTEEHSSNVIETPIANYITQHDAEDLTKEALQEISNRIYGEADGNKMLAVNLFGILYAPRLDEYGANAFAPEVKDEVTGSMTKTTLGAEVNAGKNIGLFLRKFIQKGACPTLSPEDLELMKQYIDIFTNALKTKPFLLLAGISGTGKSQKVKELAYASCPNDKELRSDKTKPGNYCLIEVKPNWHDSTELLGYWSNLSQKYMLTDFIRFAYKAVKHPEVPFFLCLDEMNLAPVEQYFAEYLSVLESRKVVAGRIESEPLLTKEKFCDCEQVDKDGKNLYESQTDRAIIEYLKANGLRLPDNLFVIGTVNMDDTTHQFSRKVIDRAFTIEMNGGKLEDMFSDENKMKLEYRPNGQEAKLELFKSNYTKATEAIESDKVKPFAEDIKTEVPKLLNAVNNILEKTPFRVSYRVQNEMVLYICNVIENATEDIDINAVIGTAFLATLLEKILPRVQGDERLLKTAEGNVFTDLKKYVEQMQNVENTEECETNFKALVIAKLDEMNDRLTKSYFASFFG